ncbi:hypothetical protein KM043_005144 [Ampulex compressa]|nr:hypothetical protein KM043_005144 [Ampulex compressa]
MGAKRLKEAGQRAGWNIRGAKVCRRELQRSKLPHASDNEPLPDGRLNPGVYPVGAHLSKSTRTCAGGFEESRALYAGLTMSAYPEQAAPGNNGPRRNAEFRCPRRKRRFEWRRADAGKNLDSDEERWGLEFGRRHHLWIVFHVEHLVDIRERADQKAAGRWWRADSVEVRIRKAAGREGCDEYPTARLRGLIYVAQKASITFSMGGFPDNGSRICMILAPCGNTNPDIIPAGSSAA